MFYTIIPYLLSIETVSKNSERFKQQGQTEILLSRLTSGSPSETKAPDFEEPRLRSELPLQAYVAETGPGSRQRQPRSGDGSTGRTQRRQKGEGQPQNETGPSHGIFV